MNTAVPTTAASSLLPQGGASVATPGPPTIFMDQLGDMHNLKQGFQELRMEVELKLNGVLQAAPTAPISSEPVPETTCPLQSGMVAFYEELQSELRHWQVLASRIVNV